MTPKANNARSNPEQGNKPKSNQRESVLLRPGKKQEREALCPRHGSPLILNQASVSFAGLQMDIIAGKCPKCEVVYTGTMPINGLKSFAIDNIQYEYCPGLSSVYSLKEDEETREQRKKADAEKRLAKEETRLNKQTTELERRYKEYQAHPERVFRPFFFEKSTESLTHCPKDSHALIFLKSSTKKAYWSCPYCGTAYYGWYDEHIAKKEGHKEKHQKSIVQVQRSDQTNRPIISRPFPPVIESLPKFPYTDKLDDLILSVELTKDYNEEKRYLYIVEKDSSQNSSWGIYWVRRTLAKNILLTALKGKHKLQIDGDTIYLKYTLGKLYRGYVKSNERFSPNEKPVTVYLFAGKQACDSGIEIVTAMIYFPDIEDYVPLTVYYSQHQHLYFMNEFVYNESVQKYGLPHLNVSRIQGNGKLEPLNDTSLLFDLGYTVSKTEGLDDNARARLLAHIMDSGRMRQAAIASHLEYLIRFHQHDYRYAEACEKWRTDLSFVLSYKKHNRRTVYGEVKKRN